MTIILYGPQGSGKTRNAPEIARHYQCSMVVECDEKDPYLQLILQPFALGIGTQLLITCREPPEELRENPRIIHINDALKAIKA